MKLRQFYIEHLRNCAKLYKDGDKIKYNEIIKIYKKVKDNWVWYKKIIKGE